MTCIRFLLRNLRSATAFLLVLGTGVTSCDLSSGFKQTTSDAYVTADFTLVAPKISGLVDQVLVEDNQSVKIGDPLVIIDARDYQAIVDSAVAEVGVAKAEIVKLNAEIARQPTLIDQAKATLASSEATIQLAQANATRYKNLSSDGAGTIQENQQAVAQLSQSQAAGSRDSANLKTVELQLGILAAEKEKAESTLKRAEAIRDQALLKLSYSVITAPIDGVVGRRSIRAGAYVNAGTTMLAIVPTDKQYVIANFQENQLEDMRLFQSVDIKVDSYPNMKLRGYVESLAPATDVAFAPIQPDNATGNFTKIVQRIPVKILLDAPFDDMSKLRVGMSVVPTVNTEKGHSNRLTKKGATK